MEQQATFEGWAVVEVMGHNTFAGYVTTEYYGGNAFFRVVAPEIPDETNRGEGEEWFLDGVRQKYPEYGAKLHRTTYTEKVTYDSPYTKLIGAGSIYAITPCTEEEHRRKRRSHTTTGDFVRLDSISKPFLEIETVETADDIAF